MADLLALFKEFLICDSALRTIDISKEIKVFTTNGTYEEMKAILLPIIPYSSKTIFTMLDKRIHNASHLVAKETANVLISGAGPCGLRSAIECALLGYQVTIYELRSECSRHNILKTWESTANDLIGLGIKIFLPSFKAYGGNLHIGTNELQLFLLKVSLLLGITVEFGHGVCGILDPAVSLPNSPGGAWRAWILPELEARSFLNQPDLFKTDVAELALKPGEVDVSKHEKISLVNYRETALSAEGAISRTEFKHDPALLNSAKFVDFNYLYVAEGQSSRLIRNLGFDRKLFRLAQAIGIVVNMDFLNTTGPETKMQEFVVTRMAAKWREGPLGPIYDNGLELENLEYMRGTKNHFLAATTKCAFLQSYGVIKEVKETVFESLQAENVNIDKLYEMGRLIGNSVGLPNDAPFCEKNGTQIFDFSCRGSCSGPFKYFRSTDGANDMMVIPIGDALQNPYWPQGLGLNGGFHNSLDGIWSAHIYHTFKDPAYVIQERIGYNYQEASYRLTDGKSWTADPISRYDNEIFKQLHRADIAANVPFRLTKRVRELIGFKE
ncbi:[F-actin]-monooxygenase mical3 [Terramyces sp. JEL0728]|nr:[F-actin]-monooxygenase mical3 [Terramyces sp. JEL0728]